MGPFAGYELPMRYEEGPVAEHHHTRTRASLFDVSHMGIVELHGTTAAEALERLVPAAIQTLTAGRARYTCLTNETGGIIDDLIVTNQGPHLSLVLNGARKDIDLAHLTQHLGDEVRIEHRKDLALLALQGPGAEAVLSAHQPQVCDMTFMTAASGTIDGIEVGISRSGYTGEDGFELTVSNSDATALAERLLAGTDVALAGLAARDSLRLEAGLCLYGQDLTTGTTPIEADLMWSIQKARRTAGGFLGDDVIIDQIANGAPRVRVGIEPLGKRPIRDGAVLRPAGQVDAQTDGGTGLVTSGGFGPSIDRPIAMGYVPVSLSAVGTELIADVRGRDEPCRVAALPFVPHNYRRS